MWGRFIFILPNVLHFFATPTFRVIYALFDRVILSILLKKKKKKFRDFKIIFTIKNFFKIVIHIKHLPENN